MDGKQHVSCRAPGAKEWFGASGATDLSAVNLRAPGSGLRAPGATKKLEPLCPQISKVQIADLSAVNLRAASGCYSAMWIGLFLKVDQGLQLSELLHCICLHTRCILEELQGIALLNVLTFDERIQVWFDQTFKGGDIILQLPLCGIEDIPCVVADVSFPSLSQTI